MFNLLKIWLYIYNWPTPIKMSGSIPANFMLKACDSQKYF